MNLKDNEDGTFCLDNLTKENLSDLYGCLGFAAFNTAWSFMGEVDDMFGESVLIMEDYYQQVDVDSIRCDGETLSFSSGIFKR